MVHHFLYFAPGAWTTRPGGCWAPASSAAAARSTRRATSPSASPPELRARYGIDNRTADGTRAGVVADRDGHEPLQAAEELLRAHARSGTRPSRARRSRRSSSATARTSQRHVLRRAGRRPAGLGVRGPSDVDGARFSGRIIGAASHHHGGGEAPDARERTCERRLFKAPVYYGAPDHTYNTIRPILHEPGPIAQRHVRARRGRPDRRGRGARARGASTTTTTCTSRRWASGRCWSCATTPSSAAGRCPRTSSRSTAHALRHARRTTTASCRSWPGRAARCTPFDGGR